MARSCLGVGRPTIDLNELRDAMTESQHGFSIMEDLSNRLEGGYRYMLSLAKLTTPNKQLLKGDDEWNKKRVLEYLDHKERFLELLMLAMHLTGGQPARGPELGSIKFRNNTSSARNVFIIGGDVFYVTEYHKTRAATNRSHFVVRYLPRIGEELFVLFIPSIRSFANLLFNQITFEKNSSDGDYLFCSEDKSDLCWEGQKPSETLQRESLSRLKVRLNIWSYRDIVVAIAREHVMEIAGHFEKNDAAWDDILSQDKDIHFYAWQTGHQRSTNISTYGLNNTYPSRLQQELLKQYLCISEVWHKWIGVYGSNSIGSDKMGGHVKEKIQRENGRPLSSRI
jgi:hypothetical protein